MKRFLTLVTLTLVISISTAAMDIPSVGLTSEEVDKIASGSHGSVPRDIPTDGYTEDIGLSTLSLVQLITDLMF